MFPHFTIKINVYFFSSCDWTRPLYIYIYSASILVNSTVAEEDNRLNTKSEEPCVRVCGGGYKVLGKEVSVLITLWHFFLVGIMYPGLVMTLSPDYRFLLRKAIDRYCPITTVTSHMLLFCSCSVECFSVSNINFCG